MDLTNKDTIRDLLVRHKLWAKKGFGQNFMTDRVVIDKTVEAAELSDEDTVLEIGPGLGVLTQELSKNAGKVVAVEKDKDILGPLLETCGNLKNLKIVNEDILKARVTSGVIPTKEGSQPARIDRGGGSSSLGMTKESESILGDKSYKIVANLPFYISSPIFRKFLSQERRPKTMVVMVQKEVAQKITAKPGEMNILAVSVQFYAKAEIIITIPANVFFPAPKVDAAVLKIIPYEKPLFDVDEKKFFRIVKAGFGERRKKLANSLSGGLQMDKEKIEKVLENINLDKNIRAESLSLEQWHLLYKNIDFS